MADNKDFDDILKNFQGYDSDGRLIVGDQSTGEFQALDKNDFSKVYDYAKTKVNPNTKFEDSYQDYQAKTIGKDKQYLGQDSEGNSVFQNQAGVIDRAKFDFTEGLKRQFGDKAFNKSSLGVNNQQAGENLNRTGFNFRDGSGGTSNLANLSTGSNKVFAAPNPPQPFKQFAPPKTNTQANTQQQSTNKVQPVQLPPSSQQPPSVMQQATQAMGQGLKNQVGTEVNQQTKAVTQPIVNDAKQQAQQQTQPYVDQAKDMANQYIPPEAQGVVGDAKNAVSTAQMIQNAIKDPKTAALNYATDYLKNQTASTMTDAGYGDYAGAGANALASALSGGNVAKNVTNSAVGSAKDAALNAGVNALTDNALDVLPGGAGSAIQVGKALLGGGTAQEKGDAAARAAAMAAYVSATGGLGAVINPTTLNMAAGLTDKMSNQTGKLGVAGKPIGLGLNVASNGMKNAAMVGGEALNAVGKTGGEFFQNQDQTLKGAKDVVKNLTSGNVGSAIKGLGSTALQAVVNNLIKTPVSALRNVASSVGNVVRNFFCFAPGTKILMKDGTSKNIEEIKIGDIVSLGGKVIAIGQAEGTDFVVIKGVHVIATHALYEDGKWIRAEDSKNIEDKYNKPDGIVYPIVTENHIVVTDGQVWSDTFEHDDQQDLTKDEIIAKLNKYSKINRLIEKYLQVKGWN